MTGAFYVPDGTRFVATEYTRGPWSPLHQHGGPPSALMARAAERAAPDMTLARITVDLLRPVPIEPLTVGVATLRAGKKVQRLIVTLTAGEQAVAHALVLLMRPQPVTVPAFDDGTLPTPEAMAPFEFPFFSGAVGYHTATEVRMAPGTFGSGRVTAWMRQRVPLLPDEAPTPTQRLLVVADSASGVSAVLDPKRFTFINSDLTVSVHRPLEGEWVGMQAATAPQPHGIGLADTRLYDTRGAIGRAVQSLVIERTTAAG